MKAFKKLLILGLTFVLCLGMGIFTACDKNPPNSDSTSDSTSASDSTQPIEPEFVYKVRTQSVGGYGLRNVTVSLYNGETKVASVLTNTLGNAYFTQAEVSTPGEYDIVLDDVPDGWSTNDSVKYKTTAETGGTYTVNFTASLLTESAPATKLYHLGDVMHDFTVQTCTGDNFTLSEELQEKDMVLLNFWASWCGPCKAEFPVMQNAYSAYQSNVSILALSTETSDSQDSVSSSRKNYGITFDMVGQPAGGVVTGHFGTASIPVSVVIDRYGVISYMHTGALTALSDFTNLFDKFVGDSYVQTVIESTDMGGGSEDSGADRLKPTVSPPSISSITPVLTNDSAFTFSWDTQDEYSWPWTIETGDDDVKYLTASNSNIHNSYATLNAEFTVAANKALAFDAYIDTEETDQLYVLIDDVIIHRFSGVSVSPAWKTKYAYVFGDGQEGKHTLTLIYMKDSSLSGGEDKVSIKNLRFVDASDLDSPSVDLNVIQNAATGFNVPDKSVENPTKQTKFQNYVNVALGEDGYYHVVPTANTPVDVDVHPLLFANILTPSSWNAYSAWQVAYLGYAVYDGHNLENLVEEFAWACNHSSNGYVPVTAELKTILQLLTKQDVVGEGYDAELRNNVYYDPAYHVSYHENEWLEMCVYYKHYGQTAIMGDSTRGITFDGAIPLKLNDVNHIVCDQSIVPLGIKHRIDVTKAGVYRFYSIVGEEYFDTDSAYDPQCWIMAADRTTMLAYSDDLILHPTNNPDNFEIYLYLEEGTYYCLFAMFLNDLGEFDMRIDYIHETRFDYFKNCSMGPHSFNPVTNETYVPDAQYYAYDPETDTYRITNENGKFLGDIYAGLDDKIYLDLTNPTHLFPYNTLSSIIENAENYATDKRLFYFRNEDGSFTDYTDVMKKYLFFAYRNNDELYGKTAITKELMDILVLLAKFHDGFGGVENSWQMLCYYYQPIAKGVQV